VNHLEEMIVVVFLEGLVVTICSRKGIAITLLGEIVIIARSVVDLKNLVRITVITAL
jgi:hypothetical protein